MHQKSGPCLIALRTKAASVLVLTLMTGKPSILIRGLIAESTLE